MRDDLQRDPKAYPLKKGGLAEARAYHIEYLPHRISRGNMTRPEDGESRFMAIGKVDGQIITVVWTQRGNRRRIISAHKGVRKGAEFRDD